MPGMCSKNQIIKYPTISCCVIKKIKFVLNVKNLLAQNLRGGIEVIHLTFLSHTGLLRFTFVFLPIRTNETK